MHMRLAADKPSECGEILSPHPFTENHACWTTSVLPFIRNPIGGPFRAPLDPTLSTTHLSDLTLHTPLCTSPVDTTHGSPGQKSPPRRYVMRPLHKGGRTLFGNELASALLTLSREQVLRLCHHSPRGESDHRAHAHPQTVTSSDVRWSPTRACACACHTQFPLPPLCGLAGSARATSSCSGYGRVAARQCTFWTVWRVREWRAPS